MSEKLRRLLRIREIARTQASLELADAMANRTDAQSKASELRGLAEEYRLQFADQGSTQAERLSQFQSFYASLAKARKAQGQLQQDAVRREEAARERYVRISHACEGLDRVIQAREAAHKVAKNKRTERQKVPSNRNSVV